MSLVKENQKYPEYFRVADAMSAAAMLFPTWDAGYAKSLVADFDLPQKRRIKKLSRGMLSAVGIVIGLASRPHSRSSTSRTSDWMPLRDRCSTTG